MTVLAAALATALAVFEAGEFRFAHHFADTNLPGGGWGQTALADIDRDGDLDFVTGKQGGEIRWYEFTGKAKWRMHLLGRDSPSDVGGAVLDVDRDGRIDFVTGGAWYRQPEDPRKGPWERFVFDARLRAVHDIVTADLDGDGRAEVVTMSDRNDVRSYTIPAADPRRPWEKRIICEPVHAGLAAGDIDGDGDVDLVRSHIWLENLEGGRRWRQHRFCGIPWAERREVSFFYHATRARVADINGDGRPDIVLTEAEFPGARIAWFEAPPDPRTVPWRAHVVSPAGEEKRGPFHTLAVADFDGDGDRDIFSAEMERFGVPPHRWFIWENRHGRFTEHVILDKELGTHEAVVGDVDGDGDIDIVGKCWSPAPNNANGGRNHIDFLENLRR